MIFDTDFNKILNDVVLCYRLFWTILFIANTNQDLNGMILNLEACEICLNIFYIFMTVYFILWITYAQLFILSYKHTAETIMYMYIHIMDTFQNSFLFCFSDYWTAQKAASMEDMDSSKCSIT